jgi:hypothetical protein
LNKGFQFGQIRQNFERTKRELPIVLAKQAENYFADSFKLGRLGTFQWKEVNRRISGTNEYKYPKLKGLSRRTSPILVRTGTLRRKVSRSVSTATWAGVRLIVDLPYASNHNDGETLPERPYMKQTNELTTMQRTAIKKTMDKIWHVQ